MYQREAVGVPQCMKGIGLGVAALLREQHRAADARDADARAARERAEAAATRPAARLTAEQPAADHDGAERRPGRAILLRRHRSLARAHRSR